MVICDYRSALQSATAPQHREIDAMFGAFDLTRRHGLTQFLTAQAIGMQACQPHAARFAQDVLGGAAPDYERLLQVDLAALGVDANHLPRVELPAHIGLPQIWDAGVFYVVAGSRMGAAVLRQRATALTPGGPAHSACGYFTTGDGPAQWRQFRQWLASAAVSPGDLPGMIAAAKATFDLFAQAARLAAAGPDPDAAVPVLAA